jgi:hypothetical protein
MIMTNPFEFVAIAPIKHDGVLAYQPGDPVHRDNVEANGYDVGGQVVHLKDYDPDEYGGPEITVDPDQPTTRGELPARLRNAQEEAGARQGQDGPQSAEDGPAGRSGTATKPRTPRAAQAK